MTNESTTPEGATPSAGATPAVSGQPDHKPEGATPTDDQLGEGGKKAIAAERARAAAAERERDEARQRLSELENANKTEQERAIEEAKKAGRQEATVEADAKLRRAEAKSALAGAGTNDLPVAIAAFMAEHPDLKVTAAGDVEKLDEAVEAFKTAHPSLFAPAVQIATADGGARPPATERPKDLQGAVASALAKQGR